MRPSSLRHGVYARRAARRDRHHRRARGPAAARRAVGPRVGSAHAVLEQSQAARPGAAQLPDVENRLPYNTQFQGGWDWNYQQNQRSWSCLARMLPYIEQSNLKEQMQILNTTNAATDTAGKTLGQNLTDPQHAREGVLLSQRHGAANTRPTTFAPTCKASRSRSRITKASTARTGAGARFINNGPASTLTISGVSDCDGLAARQRHVLPARLHEEAAPGQHHRRHEQHLHARRGHAVDQRALHVALCQRRRRHDGRSAQLEQENQRPALRSLQRLAAICIRSAAGIPRECSSPSPMARCGSFRTRSPRRSIAICPRSMAAKPRRSRKLSVARGQLVRRIGNTIDVRPLLRCSYGRGRNPR